MKWPRALSRNRRSEFIRLELRGPHFQGRRIKIEKKERMYTSRLVAILEQAAECMADVSQFRLRARMWEDGDLRHERGAS